MRIINQPLGVAALLLSLSLSVHAQRVATVLKEPADWRFEKMPVPPQFAPEIKLSGFEEIRFAPGMFDNTSPTYFTCILVISAEGSPTVGAPELKDFLEKYYRGLSVGVGRGKGLSPDPAQMNAAVTPMDSGDDAKNRYTAAVTFFDSFTDGRMITLNIEAHVVRRPESGKTYLALLVSPQPKDNAIWSKLREIGSKLSFSEAR